MRYCCLSGRRVVGLGGWYDDLVVCAVEVESEIHTTGFTDASGNRLKMEPQRFEHAEHSPTADAPARSLASGVPTGGLRFIAGPASPSARARCRVLMPTQRRSFGRTGKTNGSFARFVPRDVQSLQAPGSSTYPPRPCFPATREELHWYCPESEKRCLVRPTSPTRAPTVRSERPRKIWWRGRADT